MQRNPLETLPCGRAASRTAVPAQDSRCRWLTIRTHTIAAIAAAAVLGGCGGAPTITTCEPGNGLVPDCRFQNPEDLVASPAGGFLLVSQYANPAGGQPGSLVAYRPPDGEIRKLFPDPAAIKPAEGWGEVDCTPPDADAFAPHGIDIEQLVTGEYALYAVNHGGRESVEMFEVFEHEGDIELSWRGCVMAPPDGYFNDLVVLKSGEFRVSQMFPRGANEVWTVLRMQTSGYAPGFVYHWSPANGFERLPGTDAQFANGVEQTASRVGSAAVASPDNLAWSPTGELLVASHLGSLADTLACGSLESGSCGFRFQIVAVDPDTLASRVLIDQEGPPMGAATVARPFGDSVYLGTFAGDRIARADGAILAPAGDPGTAP
jgi:hypothetical protein